MRCWEGAMSNRSPQTESLTIEDRLGQTMTLSMSPSGGDDESSTATASTEVQDAVETDDEDPVVPEPPVVEPVASVDPAVTDAPPVTSAPVVPVEVELEAVEAVEAVALAPTAVAGDVIQTEHGLVEVLSISADGTEMHMRILRTGTCVDVKVA